MSDTDTKSALVSAYEIDAANITRLQTELVATQERARETLEALLAAHGKGPYTVNGKDVVVLRRKGTMCTMPAVRVRKSKRNTDLLTVVSEDRVTTIDTVTGDITDFEDIDPDDGSESDYQND